MTKKTKTTGATYTREPLATDKTGQCPCCLRNHRASLKGGRLARHGWKESGRQIGQHGYGFQWGSCRGSALRPLEETDADAVVILGQLAIAIEGMDEAIVRHTAGADSYPFETSVSTYYERTPEKKAALVARWKAAFTKAGLTYTNKTTTKRVQSLRVQQQDQETFTVTVARGAEPAGVPLRELRDQVYGDDVLSIPSWERLRASTVRHMEDVRKALVQQAKDIAAAVKHHRENPSTGGEDTKNKGPAVHFEFVWVLDAAGCRDPNLSVEKRTRRSIACGAGRRNYAPVSVTKTSVESEVTCSKCVKALARRKADAEERKAKAEREKAREEKRAAKEKAQAEKAAAR